MIEKIATEGKALKMIDGEGNVAYASKIICHESVAVLWVEVDEAEYINWQAEQERLADMPQE